MGSTSGGLYAGIVVLFIAISDDLKLDEFFYLQVCAMVAAAFVGIVCLAIGRVVGLRFQSLGRKQYNQGSEVVPDWDAED